MEKTKIGVIGVGTISANHIAGYLQNPDVELYALCDIDPSRLQAAGARYGVTRLYESYEEMLKLEELDAVSVCTWNSMHAPCTIAALNAGKHVLCEKPMATTTEDALAMQQAAEKNGKLLMIGFVRRFGNDCATLKEFIDSDFFGEIYYAKANYLRRNGNPGGWFGNKALSGGGPLIDLGVHVIDLSRYLMGNPKPVSVFGATFHKLGNRSSLKDKKGYVSATANENDICDVEDLASALVRYDNGAVLQIEASYSLNMGMDEGDIRLFGTKAGARLNPEVELFTETNNYLTQMDFAQSTALSFDGLFEREIEHFVHCVRTGAPCRNPAEDGVTIMRILNAVYESANSGHEVVLD